MARPEQEPEKAQGDRGERYTHPAFGQISVSRISGQTHLYGSDFQHRSYVAIRIKRSTLERSLSQDWHYGGDELIEVALSEAQWATFVSSFGVGEGTPCTIERLGKQSVPGIPFRTQQDAYKNDMRKRIDRSVLALKKLKIALVEGVKGLTKQKASELTGAVDSALMEIEQNAPFVANSFDEYVEDMVEKAKVEVHGYVNGVIQHAGLQALQKPLLTTPEPQELLERDDDHDG